MCQCYDESHRHQFKIIFYKTSTIRITSRVGCCLSKTVIWKYIKQFVALLYLYRKFNPYVCFVTHCFECTRTVYCCAYSQKYCVICCRFDEKENVSNCIQLKTSVIKGIKNQLLEQFPDIESWLNHIMPKKDPVKIVRW